MENPFQAPAAEITGESTATARLTEKTKRLQSGRWLTALAIGSNILMLCFSLVQKFFGEELFEKLLRNQSVWLQYLIAFTMLSSMTLLILGLFIASVIGTIRIATTLGYSKIGIVILAVLAFYPVISLIVLIYLNLQARKRLRAATDNRFA